MRDELLKRTAAVKSHAAFFHRIRQEGGRVEFFIGWFAEGRNFGDSIDAHLLKILGELGVDLAFDVYERDDKKSSS